MALKRGLGRGIGSLIPTDEEENVKPAGLKKNNAKQSGKTASTKETNTSKTSKTSASKASAKNVEEVDGNNEVYININDIEPNVSQPRKNFDEDALHELAESIKKFGIIEPIIVTKKNKGFEIIAGERRWRAARMAGLKKVPVMIRDYSTQEKVEIALIENIQRENLNPIEEALCYKRLIEEFNLKQDEVAERVSKSRTAVTNSMRLLKLTEKVRDMVVDGMLSSGHARTLISIEDPDVQYETAMTIFDQGLSVRDTEALVKNVVNILNNKVPEEKKKEENKAKAQIEAVLGQYSENLKQVLGAKVKITSKGKKGKIEIEYASSDDLERIIHLIQQSNK